jgi:hypothetical protein
MPAKVFISYRREDSAAYAGRIQDRLERELGRDLLFIDVDGIPLGVNFVKVLHEEVAQCGVLLAVIGPSWLDLRDEDGTRRLDNPTDFVRIEIAAALQREIPVIPILLDGTRVPKADQLPEDLKELALRNGLNVHHASFHTDLDRLIRELNRQLGVNRQAASTPIGANTPSRAENKLSSPAGDLQSVGSGVKLPPEGKAELWLLGDIVRSMGLTTHNFPDYVNAVVQQYIDIKYTSNYAMTLLARMLMEMANIANNEASLILEKALLFTISENSVGAKRGFWWMLEAIANRLTDQSQIPKLQHLFDVAMAEGIPASAEGTIYALLNSNTARRIVIEDKLLDYYMNHKAKDVSLLIKIDEITEQRLRRPS